MRKPAEDPTASDDGASYHLALRYAQAMIEEKPIPWLELLEVPFRRWRILVSGLVIGLLSGALLAWMKPPEYRAQARIILTAQAVPGPREDAMSDKQIQAELAFLRSPALIRGVLEDFERRGRLVHPEKGPLGRIKDSVANFLEKHYLKLHDVDPPSFIDRMVRAVAAQIEAGPLQGSNLVEVAFTSNNPEWAADFVNELLEHHVDRIANFNDQPQARDFFEGQLDFLGERWEKAQEAVAAFREQHEASLLAGDENQLRAVLSELESERVAAETAVLEARATVEFLAAEIDKHPETIAAESRVTENESVSYLKSRILELEIKRSEMLSRYTPTSTLIQEINRQIEEASRLLASKEGETLAETTTAINPAHQTLAVELVQTRAELSSAEARVRALATQIASYREKLGNLEGTTAEFDRLTNELESAKESYQASTRLREEARFSSALGESRIVNLSLVDRAEVPLTAEPTKRGLTILLVTILGLLLAIGLALLRDWMDPSIKCSAQAARLAGVPVIAEIPSR